MSTCITYSRRQCLKLQRLERGICGAESKRIDQSIIVTLICTRLVRSKMLTPMVVMNTFNYKMQKRFQLLCTLMLLTLSAIPHCTMESEAKREVTEKRKTKGVIYANVNTISLQKKKGPSKLRNRKSYHSPSLQQSGDVISKTTAGSSRCHVCSPFRPWASRFRDHCHSAAHIGPS